MTAATRQSTAPHTSDVPCAVAAPTSTAPLNATSAPITSQRGKPSPSSSPANSAMRIGPTLTSIAVVPASTRCSAALRATLYAANQATPATAMSSHSRRFGVIHRRLTSTDTPSARVPTSRRPSASGPGS